MAPEQLAGKGATVRSDIYALGLILYEIACGKKAFTAGTIAELREEKEGHTPRAPSEIHGGVDPILERLITRCIERDPSARPNSAKHLAASLPGGDPLAAAIAAGETPSPEMVAAAGLKEGLHPDLAVALVAILILSLIGIAALNPTAELFQVAPGRPPDILTYNAREFLAKAGYTGAPADRAFNYTVMPVDFGRLPNVPSRFLVASGFGTLFWYRESPQPIVHRAVSGVALDDPPMRLPGEARIQTDTEGLSPPGGTHDIASYCAGSVSNKN